MQVLTTMQQVNRQKRAGNLLFCAWTGSPRAEIRDVRYSQSSFQVKIVGGDDWVKPSRIWAEQAQPGPAIADFWSKPVYEQMRLSCQYGEPPEPLTDEEKQEMEGCGC